MMRTLLRQDRGAAALEFALAAPVLLVAGIRYSDDTRDARDWTAGRPLAHPVPATHHFGSAPTPREVRRADGCTMIYSVTALSGGRRDRVASQPHPDPGRDQ